MATLRDIQMRTLVSTLGVAMLGSVGACAGTATSIDDRDGASSAAHADAIGIDVSPSDDGGRFDSTSETGAIDGASSQSDVAAEVVTLRDATDDASILDSSEAGEAATYGSCFANTAQQPATGSDPVWVATSDLNADGVLDLVVANYFATSVSVLLGVGDGSFAPQAVYDVGPYPSAVAIGDLDGDGKPDLVVANSGTDADGGGDDVSVLLGVGDGTFKSQTTWPIGPSPSSVVIADVNGDGVPDLVAADEGTPDLSVLLDKGPAAFWPRLTFAGPSGYASIAVADVNSDGRADVVAPDSASKSVAVLLGNGAGAFRDRTDYVVGIGPDSVAVGDLNGDGKLDLAVGNYDDGTVSVLLGNGDGTFQSQVAYPSGLTPISIAMVDLDGDGTLDLVVVNRATGTDEVSVLAGHGDGTLTPPVPYHVGSSPESLAVGDFNRDGRPDLAVTSLGDNDVNVLLGVCGVPRFDGGADGGGRPFDAGACPTSFPPCIGPTAFVGGALHTCALVSTGSVECAGANYNGQLGDGTTTSSTTPVAVSNLSGAIALTAGSGHNCALRGDGVVLCWGFNGVGQVGNGTTTDAPTPVVVSNSASVVALAAGYDHTCALLATGSVECWGGNSLGQLGNGTTKDSATPVPVSNLSGAIGIAAGGNVSCALQSGGAVSCWGDNSYGQLGNGAFGNSTTPSPTPAAVPGLTGISTLSIGESAACAVFADGSVSCWGGTPPASGAPDASSTTATPTIVPALSGVVSVSVTAGSSCALEPKGRVLCWGAGGATPSALDTLSGPVASILAGGDANGQWCVLLTSGVPECWGYNAVGQLGIGTTTNAPTAVQANW